ADYAEFEGLSAEDIDCVPVPLKAVGVEIRAHYAFGFFELGFQPRRNVREIAHGGGELGVAAGKSVGKAACNPFVPFPNIPAQDHQVLWRKAAGLAEILAFNRPDVGK